MLQQYLTCLLSTDSYVLHIQYYIRAYRSRQLYFGGALFSSLLCLSLNYTRQYVQMPLFGLSLRAFIKTALNIFRVLRREYVRSRPLQIVLQFSAKSTCMAMTWEGGRISTQPTVITKVDPGP
jgi:hypothetical protein